MHNLKKIYLMMSDRLHDAVNDFSHPRSEDLSKVHQKYTHHWKFKTIILGNKSVKTELYTRRLWEQTEKFEYPTYLHLAMLQSFGKTKTFRNLKHLPRKLTWHLIQKKSLSWIKPPSNALNENQKRKHTGYSTFGFHVILKENLHNVQTNPFFKQYLENLVFVAWQHLSKISQCGQIWSAY